MICPPGWIKIKNQCVPVGIDSKKAELGRRSIPIRSKIPSPSKAKPDYSKLKRLGHNIRTFWDERPDSLSWTKSFNVPSVVKEGVEEIIDLQFIAADKISSGDLQGVNLYNDIERERVDSLGFKALWTPGGFQV